MIVASRVHQRILRAIADVRVAATRHNAAHRAKAEATVRTSPAANPAAPSKPAEPDLHLMLPKPHTSIW